MKLKQKVLELLQAVVSSLSGPHHAHHGGRFNELAHNDHVGDLTRYFARRSDSCDVEDQVHESFVRFFDHVHKYGWQANGGHYRKESVGRFLQGIAKNVHHESMRYHAVTKDHADADAVPIAGQLATTSQADPDAAEQAMMKELQDQLTRVEQLAAPRHLERLVQGTRWSLDEVKRGLAILQLLLDKHYAPASAARTAARVVGKATRSFHSLQRIHAAFHAN